MGLQHVLKCSRNSLRFLCKTGSSLPPPPACLDGPGSQRALSQVILMFGWTWGHLSCNPPIISLFIPFSFLRSSCTPLPPPGQAAWRPGSRFTSRELAVTWGLGHRKECTEVPALGSFNAEAIRGNSAQETGKCFSGGGLIGFQGPAEKLTWRLGPSGGPGLSLHRLCLPKTQSNWILFPGW